MYKVLFVIALFFQIFCFQEKTFGMGKNEVPTAIVVDAETGKPIEGAVAIAIWRKHSTKEAAWFEGGTMVVVRIEEALSDKNGKIYINDFWGWHLLENRYPRLTIYKFGYVCWDQKQLFTPVDGSTIRKDFDEKNRIVRMEKWPKDFSFNGHASFIRGVTYGDFYEASKKLFIKAWDKEKSYRIEENTIINKRRGVR